MVAHNAYGGNTSAGSEWKVEPSWNDLQGSVAEGSAGAALTFAAFRDTPFKLANFRNAQADELHMVYQMSHAWAPGTELHPHMHVIPLSNPAGSEVIRWTGVYRFTGHGVEVPALASWTAFTADLAVVPGDINKIRVIRLATVTPPADSVESDMLLLYVVRDGGAVADTYSGAVAALSIRPKDLVPVVGLTLGLTDPISGLNMGQTAENLARDFGITRREQDEFALWSHQK